MVDPKQVANKNSGLTGSGYKKAAGYKVIQRQVDFKINWSSWSSDYSIILVYGSLKQADLRIAWLYRSVNHLVRLVPGSPKSWWFSNHLVVLVSGSIDHSGFRTIWSYWSLEHTIILVYRSPDHTDFRITWTGWLSDWLNKLVTDDLIILIPGSIEKECCQITWT